MLFSFSLYLYFKFLLWLFCCFNCTWWLLCSYTYEMWSFVRFCSVIHSLHHLVSFVASTIQFSTSFYPRQSFHQELHDSGRKRMSSDSFIISECMIENFLDFNTSDVNSSTCHIDITLYTSTKPLIAFSYPPPHWVSLGCPSPQVLPGNFLSHLLLNRMVWT